MKLQYHDFYCHLGKEFSWLPVPQGNDPIVYYPSSRVSEVNAKGYCFQGEVDCVINVKLRRVLTRTPYDCGWVIQWLQFQCFDL